MSVHCQLEVFPEINYASVELTQDEGLTDRFGAGKSQISTTAMRLQATHQLSRFHAHFLQTATAPEHPQT